MSQLFDLRYRSTKRIEATQCGGPQCLRVSGDQPKHDQGLDFKDVSKYGDLRMSDHLTRRRSCCPTGHLNVADERERRPCMVRSGRQRSMMSWTSDTKVQWFSLGLKSRLRKRQVRAKQSVTSIKRHPAKYFLKREIAEVTTMHSRCARPWLESILENR